MQGAAIEDLQDALLLLISHQIIKSGFEPNWPTPDELQALTQRLKQERVQSTFGDATWQLIRYVQNQQGLGDSLAGIVEARTAAVLNRLLTDLGALSQSPLLDVTGRVYSPQHASVGGLRVQVVDKIVGPDVLLAEGTTDDAGKYALSYSVAKVVEQGKSAPDIQVRVLRGETFLGASEVRYNATPAETLDVLLPAAAASTLLSEHETLTGTMAAHYKGPLARLEESDTRQDITYLANKTGWDARAVALAALADQFSAGTLPAGTTAPAIAPAFFYALFRAGLPANEDILYHTDAQTLETVWTTAAEQGVIPNSLMSTIPAVVKQFQTLSAQKLLTGSALTGVSSLQALLVSSRLTEEQQQQFATLYTANRTDLQAFWKAVGVAFGQDTATRLQVDGKLARLTINNAPLMQALHGVGGTQGLSDPLQLAQAGYHRAAKWDELVKNAPIPKEIPGDTLEARQANYAAFLAAQVRLSYPTAAVAEMVLSGVLPVSEDVTKNQVHGFLTGHQGKFEIGMQPVEQYIARNNIEVTPELQPIVTQIKKLQRVYQITQNDQAMVDLLKRRIGGAYDVVRFDKEAFIQSFAPDLGGTDQAALVYERSQLIHNTTLNVAVSYLLASTGMPLGASPMMLGAPGVQDGGQVLRPAPGGPSAENAADVIAYPTLESLFGSMDFCACDHCRSILSPAAYLVDLLYFMDRDPTQQEAEAGMQNPQAVLLERRPDIQHLPLSCENTNTALPYIDVVNETLEYFIANNVQQLSIKDYTGHDTNGVASEDLLASPQFVIDSAYTILRDERFPLPLPFHQPLENLRRLFEKFEVPLALAMERLRKTDALERGANPYGWRDILMEELGLSREEYEILTDSIAVPLWRMYGFPNGTVDEDVTAGLANAKLLARRVGISYEDLVSLLQTRFINPNSDLIPKLERLGVPFALLAELKTNNNAATDARFDAMLAQLAVAPDPAAYDGDIKAWVKNPDNFARIMAIITLAVPAGKWVASKSYVRGNCVRPTTPQPQEEASLYYECTTPGTSAASEPHPWPTTPGQTYTDGTVGWTCRDEANCQSFDNLALRYADPGKVTQDLSAADCVRLLRFIRLWKKTGWSIEQTDAAICALYRADLAPLTAGDIDTVAKLDTGFLTLLPRLGIVVRVMPALHLTPNHDLLSLLACWSDIGTHGDHALYRQMFLNAAMLNQDAIFADNGYGAFLQKATVPYTHSQATLDQTILNAAQGRISYDNSHNQLSYSGVLDTTIRDVLKAVTDVSDSFKAAVDALYATQRLTAHVEALRSAFHLTGEEYARIITTLRYDTNTPLTLPNITAIYRRGWLARKLHVSVRELLLLSALTGLDLFVLPDPTHPAILRLIALVQAMQDRSLKSAAALYLIWNQDLSGKSAPDPLQVAAFARTLRLAFTAVETEFTIQDDPDGTIAQARMTLVYGADVAAFFFGLLNNTLTTEVNFSDPDGTMASGALRQAIENAAGATEAGSPRIVYDDFRKRLSYSGFITTAIRDAIKLAAGTGAAAFTTAVDDLYAKNQAAVFPFFARYPELQPLYEAYVADTVPSVTAKRNTLLKQILPELVKQRKAQQTLQTLSAAVAVDLAFAQALLAPSVTAGAVYPLHAVSQPDQPALNDVLALETQGLSVQFFANDTATGTIIPFDELAANLDYAPAVGGGGNPLPANPTHNSAISGIWCGYIQTPDNGFYKLRIETDPGATVMLLLDGKPLDLTQPGELWENTKPLELRAGTLYALSLTVQKVRNIVRVQWEWDPKGHGRVVIPPRYLYPATLFERFQETYVRFLKAASLATGLGLTVNEMAYFATHADYRINAQGQIDSNGQGWLNALSNTDNLHLTNPADAAVAKDLNAALLKPFEALLDYAQIKTALAPGDESLLRVLQDPATATAEVDSALFALTRWDRVSLNDLLAYFGGNIAGLAQFDQFRRVYDAFALIQTMGIPASALIRATTNAPDGEIVRDFQAALRARYAAADWRDLIQPLNDTMRILQRDALVAYILHHMRGNPDTAHIDTPDKLFEYFLMDVQMEPCMQTSRIRHALSSVQLFIERCLMNLETRVSPASINAAQWTWMKRYRVWEANRKVFLWPENWLEPELRDDKSPFFKEIESELLQSDITEDSATTALLNYLAKLEEVAKLEPCGMHYVEPTATQGEVIHLVARTAGAHRKYYYRRYEFGYWTPWEQIKLDIEDNPVIPVVWNDRLLLFWLRLLKKGPDTANKPAAGDLIALKIENLPGAPMVTVQGVLCWSEFYNGKWQPTKTSDVDQPITFGNYPPDTSFQRSWLRMRTFVDGEALRILFVGFGSFLLYNTHSLPVQDGPPLVFPAQPGKTRTLGGGGDKYDLTSIYSVVTGTESFAYIRVILKPQSPLSSIMEAENYLLQDEWNAPFFVADSRHVFLVTTQEHPVWVRDYGSYGIFDNAGVMNAEQIPPLVVQTAPLPKPKVWGDRGPISPERGAVDPAPMQRFITEDAYIRRGLPITRNVQYGNRQIGPAGAISNGSAER
jgi:hypothetical protein